MASAPWQIDRQEYDAICAYLGLIPKAQLYDRLSRHLSDATFRFGRPQGFSLYLAKRPLTRARIARLDLATKLFFPDHPVRHVLNGVIALHECHGEGYAQMSAAPSGWRLAPALLGWALGFSLRLLLTLPWLAGQFLVYIARTSLRVKEDLEGQTVLITGVNRGLGKDLMLHCLDQGAHVIGTVRNRQSRDQVKPWLPAQAPVRLLVADLSTSEALVDAVLEAQIAPASIRLAILCAGVKHSGASALSLPSLRDTFQVNYFAAVEFAAWLCGADNRQDQRDPRRPGKTALVLVSSMGRWHGMHSSAGYNASKAALSIWGESLEMELRRYGDRRFTVTIVEPGIFESGMTRKTGLARVLSIRRSHVAARVVSAAVAGRRVIRPPLWFALLTWGVCLAGRNFRYRLFAGAKTNDGSR